MNRFKTGRACFALILTAALAACSDSAGPGAGGDGSPLEQNDLRQVDRFGLPAIATVFIPSNQDDAYNAAQPAGDRGSFRNFVVTTLQSFGHPDPNGLADALLPDIQGYDTSQPSGFLNGRRLQDDVITAELGLIFGGNAALNDDNVDANDKQFLAVFPYLAGPFIQ